jgi:hypothetical protein
MAITSFPSFLQKVDQYILNPIILLLFAVATVYFIYGIVKYLSLDPSDAKRKEARDAIIWGLVGMLIMFSVYGLIGFVLTTFGVSTSNVPFINSHLQ